MIERLQKSIKQYRTILEHARQLDRLLTQGEPKSLQEYTQKLVALQNEAGLNDQELLAEMARDANRWQIHPLSQERMQLLKQIVEMNDLLLPRIRGMMSVAAAELGQIREGRVAMTGYYPTMSRAAGSIRGVG